MLAECLLPIVRSLVRDDEFADPVDADALAGWLGETLHLWRKRMTQG